MTLLDISSNHKTGEKQTLAAVEHQVVVESVQHTESNRSSNNSRRITRIAGRSALESVAMLQSSVVVQEADSSYIRDMKLLISL
jgi:hypothetical protein